MGFEKIKRRCFNRMLPKTVPRFLDKIFNIEHTSTTGERIRPDNFQSTEDYILWLRHLFAYTFVEKKILNDHIVLEVGCGEGYGTSIISKNSFKTIGLDVDKKTILHATKRYKTTKCIFKHYDGVNIPYCDNTFDVIISFQVIEHIEADINFISEIYRVLKKNGLFFVTTPNKTYRLKPNQKPWNRYHKREYDSGQLKKVLLNDFSDIKVYGIKGCTEIQKIENDRIKKILYITYLDVLHLRSYIPEFLKYIVLKFLNCVIFNNSVDNYSEINFTLNNYCIIKNNIEESLDLIGICRK